MTLILTVLTTEERAIRRVGSVLDGRFELKRLIGVGAAGAVYEAHHRYTERLVAVKVLHAQLLESREHVARFLREVRAMSALNHPNIAALLDAGRSEDDVPYMVTEFLEGSDMADLMDEGALPRAHVFEIGAQLLDGLGAAHKMDIVHRDVKPDNVFLLPRPGQAPQVKLIDFGVAKRLAATSSVALTASGTTVGTPHYMSPEQARGEPVDARSDLWSVGATLYHAFSDEPPFDDQRTHKLLIRIATERPPSLSTRCPRLNPDLIKVIDRALEPNPEKRWQTAKDMANALTLAGYADFG